MRESRTSDRDNREWIPAVEIERSVENRLDLDEDAYFPNFLQFEPNGFTLRRHSGSEAVVTLKRVDFLSRFRLMRERN